MDIVWQKNMGMCYLLGHAFCNNHLTVDMHPKVRWNYDRSTTLTEHWQLYTIGLQRNPMNQWVIHDIFLTQQHQVHYDLPTNLFSIALRDFDGHKTWWAMNKSYLVQKHVSKRTLMVCDKQNGQLMVFGVIRQFYLWWIICDEWWQLVNCWCVMRAVLVQCHQ